MNNKNIQKKFYNDFFQNNSHQNDLAIEDNASYFTKRFLNLVINNGKKKVLEIGCGDGFLTQFLLLKPLEITAIDISGKAIESLKLRFSDKIKEGSLKIFCSDIVDFMENTEDKYDLIIGSGIIHHIEKERWSELFLLANEKLNANGIFACGPEPNAGGLFRIIWRMAPFFYKLFGIEYEWEVEKGTLDMKPRKLEIMLKKAGFKKIEISPFQVIPHFHLKILEKIDKKIINLVTGNLSMYIIVKGEKL